MPLIITSYLREELQSTPIPSLHVVLRPKRTFPFESVTFEILFIDKGVFGNDVPK